MDALVAPAERTLPAMLRRGAARFGERPLLAIAGARVAHATPPRPRRARAGALRAAGIGRGDRVALMCGNRIELLETFLACGWIGAVAVPINTAAMGPQIEYYLANSGARLLVIEAKCLAVDHGGCAPALARPGWSGRLGLRRIAAPAAVPGAVAGEADRAAAVSPAIRSPSSTPRAPPGRRRA